MIVIRVIYDECKLLFLYIETYAYYVYNLVYFCRSLIGQKLELAVVLKGNSGLSTSWPQMKEHEKSKRTSHH